jgi:hypothetical protein
MSKFAFTAACMALAVMLWESRPAQAFGVGGARVAGYAGPRGVGVSRAAGGTRVGPAGGVQSAGVRGGTYVAPNGTRIQAGRVAGASRGPFGAVNVGGAQGMRVTTPSGRTYTTGSAGSATRGPYGGMSASGVRGTATSGPFGSSAFGQRGGVAIGPGGRAVGGTSSGAIRTGPGGVVAGGTRTGFAAGPGGVVRSGTSAGFAAGRYGVPLGHRTTWTNAATFNTWGHAVRTSYAYPYFNRTWYNAHPTAWSANRWVNASANYWTALNYASFINHVGLGFNTQPIYYDYGSTLVIINDTVYLNGQKVSSATEYAQQADALAQTGRRAQPAADEEWQPLGVFGLMQGDEETAQRMFQLAVNKAGVLRGNYYDAVADHTLPVYGSLDKKTQRVAWSIGDKKEIVFEAGMNNLTQNETTILVHFGKESSQQMLLVRLEEPK